MIYSSTSRLARVLKLFGLGIGLGAVGGYETAVAATISLNASDLLTWDGEDFVVYQ